MIITTDRYQIRSASSNEYDYWAQDVFPSWMGLTRFHPNPRRGPGHGVEPHYHDGDEIWLFTVGRGEIWLDDKIYPITPNTIIYTPMGVVHRFQMFTDVENVDILGPLERQKRGIHILVDVHGPPEPSVSGFTVPGAENTGPIKNRGTRCPLSELRLVTWSAGEGIEVGQLPRNEHWAVVRGRVEVQVDDLTVELTNGDLALMRAGATRSLRALDDTSIVLMAE